MNYQFDPNQAIILDNADPGTVSFIGIISLYVYLIGKGFLEKWRFDSIVDRFTDERNAESFGKGIMPNAGVNTG